MGRFLTEEQHLHCSRNTPSTSLCFCTCHSLAWDLLTPDLRMNCSILPCRESVFHHLGTFSIGIKITPTLIFKSSLYFTIYYLSLQPIVLYLTAHSPFHFFDLDNGYTTCSLYENSSSWALIILKLSLYMLYFNKDLFKDKRKTQWYTIIHPFQ